MHTDAQFLTVDQAAAVLAVHPATIRRRVRSGALPAVQLGGPGKAVRIAEGELTCRAYGSSPGAEKKGGRTLLSPYEAQQQNVDMDAYWQKVEAQRRADYIRGLLEERRGAVMHERDDQIKAIDAELARVGHEAAPPAKRAETRERKGATT